MEGGRALQATLPNEEISQSSRGEIQGAELHQLYLAFSQRKKMNQEWDGKEIEELGYLL